MTQRDSPTDHHQSVMRLRDFLTLPFRWMAGLPPRRPKSFIRVWMERLLILSVILLTGWFFILGPGRILMPSPPAGFSVVSEGSITVYYPDGDSDIAYEAIRIAREAQTDILTFWNDRNSDAFESGLRIYLCRTSEEYLRLTGNRAGGSALFGQVVLDMSKVGIVLSLSDYVRHEMAHTYITRSFGWLRMVLGVPKWLDDGAAVLLQVRSPDITDLTKRLQAFPVLVPLSSMMRPWDWEAMVAYSDGILARRVYGYTGWFLEKLLDRYGREKLLRYKSLLSPLRDSETLFKHIYGLSLDQVESSFLEEAKRSGTLPEDLRMVSLSYPPTVLFKWLGGTAILLFVFLWIIRQFLRILRYVAVAFRPDAAHAQS